MPGEKTFVRTCSVYVDGVKDAEDARTELEDRSIDIEDLYGIRIIQPDSESEYKWEES